MEWIKKLSTLKKVLLIFSQAILIACVILWVFANNQETGEKNEVLIKKLESLLPPEAKGKVFINHSLQSTRKPMVSTVFTVSQYKQKEIADSIAHFMIEGKLFLEANDYIYSALVMTVLIVETNEQFRVVLGHEVIEQMPEEAFFDYDNLFKWLFDNCARTDSTKIEKYCHITKNLKKAL